MYRQNLKFIFLLILVAFFWGLGYPLMKIAIMEVPIFNVLWIRFFFAAILMLPFCRYNLLRNKKLWILGAILGTVLFFSFALIILGLERTTATSTGFLSALFILWVPVLSKIFFGQSLSLNILIAIPISLLGIFCIFDTRLSTFYYGEVLVLLGSLFTAIHILLIEKYSKLYSSIELTFVQFFFIACWSIFLSIFLYDFVGISSISMQFIVSMILLVLFSTLLAFWIQTKYQPYISPEKAAIIFNTEPLFSALFAVLILHEALGVYVYIGGILIMLSLFISQGRLFGKY